MEEILSNYRILVENLSDGKTFSLKNKAAYLSFKENEPSGTTDAYINNAASIYIKHVNGYVSAMQKEAGIFADNALPLIYMAWTNLKALKNQLRVSLQHLRDYELSIYALAEGLDDGVSFPGNPPESNWTNETIQDVEFGITEMDLPGRERGIKHDAIGFAEDAAFVKEVLIPLLQKVIDAVEDQFASFDKFYGPFLEGLEGPLAKGSEAVARISEALLNIKHREDITAMLHIASRGEVIGGIPLEEYLPAESKFSPQQLGILFYLLREEGIITNPNDRELSWYISLMTRLSHNTIYSKGLRKMVPVNNFPTVLQDVNRKKQLINASVLKESLNNILKKISQAEIEYEREFK